MEKYWLTGVLPAFRDGISPLTATRVISFDQQYQSLCGFTQEDVEAIVSRALHHFPEKERDLALKALKHWYNGYKFCPMSGSEIPWLYNPQLVFIHMEKMISGSSHMPYLDEANAVHGAIVLSAVGDTGDVTIHHLMDMLSTSTNRTQARIFSELSYLELMQEGRSGEMTWSLLYYLGIVTHHQDKGYLCIPNFSMSRLVSPDLGISM